MDKAALFSGIRKSLFGGKLSQDVVSDIEAILDAWALYGDGHPPKLAYVLGTAFHESDRFKTMEEYASGAAYEGRRDLGNTQKGDGRRFKGRGFVQITGRRNYADWAKRTGQPLLERPALVSQRPLAARILVQGMMLGTFTGKKLGTYVSRAKVDFKGARRVVNGTDRAALIAGYADKFLVAIRGAEQATLAPARRQSEVDPVVASTVEPNVAPTKWWERLLGVKAPVIALVGKLHPRGDEVLFRQQNRLLNAGYTEVGDPDGLWGTNTWLATTAALKEQAPNVTPPEEAGGWPWSNEVTAAVARLERRKVSEARAKVGWWDMLKRGSTPQKAPAVLVAGGALSGVVKAASDAKDWLDGLSDQASGYVQTARVVFDFLGSAGSLAWEFRTPLIYAGSIAAIYFGGRWLLRNTFLARIGSIRQTRL